MKKNLLLLHATLATIFTVASMLYIFEATQSINTSNMLEILSWLVLPIGFAIFYIVLIIKSFSTSN